MKIKLCGFKTQDAINVAVAKHVNFVGFVFEPNSPRYIEPEVAANLSKSIPATIDRVAVFSNNDLTVIKQINKILKPEYFQFHGNETPGFLEKIQEIFPDIKIIKAFQISSYADLRNVHKFQKCCDAYLFDSKTINNQDPFSIAGGSGKSFDWKILSSFRSRKPWFLSGGINIKNFSEACKISGAKMIDVSSGIEETKGVKSINMIEKLMDKVNNVHQN
jgi:phosphoribosylanthranilate isomerase